MQLTINAYRDRLPWLESDLVEASADDRPQINADIAWVRHAITNYNLDPMVMAYNLANRVNMMARHNPERDLANDHTRTFQKKALKGNHFCP